MMFCILPYINMRVYTMFTSTAALFLSTSVTNETDSRQDKTRQDKTRQDKTRQDKTRQDKTRQDKTRQDKTRQDKTRQDKARQGKTRQGKARQGKARQGKARQGKARQGKARQGKHSLTHVCVAETIVLRSLGFTFDLAPATWLYYIFFTCSRGLRSLLAATANDVSYSSESMI